MKNNIFYKFSILILSITSVISLSKVAVAESAIPEKDQAQERWFQIELIVFQQTDLSDLRSEQWPEHIKIRDFQQVVDFLSPLPAKLITDEVDQSTTETEANIEHPPELLAPITEPAVTDPPLLSFELLQSELPFLPLQNSYSALNDEVTSIKRSRKYRLLKHITWRQPIFNEKQAVSVRILGGDDFAENFNADGTKIQKSSIDYEELNTDSRVDEESTIADEFTPDDLINAQIKEALPLNADNYFDPIDLQDPLETPEAPPETGFEEFAPAQPHVWELDGVIRIHLRRYLHIKLDLEIKQLQQKLISTEQFDNFTNNQDFLNSEVPESGFEINWESVDVSKENAFINPEQADADTLKVDYLQPYPLIQQRRVRSKEIHYFDNPILGVMVLITPYENLPEAEAEEEDSLNQE